MTSSHPWSTSAVQWIIVSCPCAHGVQYWPQRRKTATPWQGCRVAGDEDRDEVCCIIAMWGSRGGTAAQWLFWYTVLSKFIPWSQSTEGEKSLLSCTLRNVWFKSPNISRAYFLLQILKFIPHLITSFLPHLYSNQNNNWAAPPPSSASSTSPLLSAPAPCSPPGAGRAAQLTSSLQCVFPYRTLYFSDSICYLDHCIYNCDNRILHKGVISKSLYRLFNTEIHKKERVQFLSSIVEFCPYWWSFKSF